MNDDILLDSAARATLDDYYDAFLPDGSRRVLENVARALDSEAAAHDRRLRLTRLTLLAAAAAIVALVVIAPLWFRGSTPPAATASASASASVRPSAAATVPPAPTVSLPAPIVYPAPDATLNPDATVAAQVERVGQIRTGGLWAIQRGVSDAWLLLSFDGGGSWSRQRIELSDEIADSVFVLDADHAWSIVTAPGTAAPMYRTHAPTAVDPPESHLRIVVNRTSDGGRTWQASDVLAGDYANRSLTLSFVDARRGFLMASTTGIEGPSTLLGTDDGGSTWHVVEDGWALPGTSGSEGPGSEFTAADANTLWAGMQDDPGRVRHAPLAVSHDGGRTWERAVPDLVGDSTWRATPTFSDANNGVVTVEAAAGTFNILRTSDGGRTWAGTAFPEPVGAFSLAAPGTWWATADANPPTVSVTTDGGHTWIRRQPGSLPESPVAAAFADATHGVALVRHIDGVDYGFDPNANSMAMGVMFVTADGGATWRLAPIAAMPATPPPATADAAAAKQAVGQWETALQRGDYEAAWSLLAPDPARPSKAAWIADIQNASQPSWRDWLSAYHIGDVTRATRVLATDYWYNLVSEVADQQRACHVAINHPNAGGASAGSEILIVAPFRDGSGWHIWLIH